MWLLFKAPNISNTVLLIEELTFSTDVDGSSVLPPANPLPRHSPVGDRNTAVAADILEETTTILVVGTGGNRCSVGPKGSAAIKILLVLLKYL